MANCTKFTPKKKSAFLQSLESGASVAKAAHAASVTRRTVYNWREADPAFCKEWDDAVECGTDVMEDEVRRRGHDGYDEPEFYKGAIVATVRKYSDTLLIFFLKGRRPHKYRDNAPPQSQGVGRLRELIVSLKE